MDQEPLLMPALYSGVQRHAAALPLQQGQGQGKGKGVTKMGRRRMPQVNLHAAAAISGSTVMWATCPNYGTLRWEVKSWHKPQGLTLNLNSAERVTSYLYLCYTDPLKLPPKTFDSRHNRSKLFQTKHMGH
jgi:hypothetical protein